MRNWSRKTLELGALDVAVWRKVIWLQTLIAMLKLGEAQGGAKKFPSKLEPPVALASFVSAFVSRLF